MTTRFVSAAEMMARVLGMPGYAFAVIDHPVSSATDAELAERARSAIEQGLKMLVQDKG
jgi:predicted dienelactone hydrolase